MTLKAGTTSFKVFATSSQTIVRNLDEFWTSKPTLALSNYGLSSLKVEYLRTDMQTSRLNPTQQVVDKLAAYNNQVILENFQILLAKDICFKLTKLSESSQNDKEIQVFFFRNARITQDMLATQLTQYVNVVVRC